MAKGERKKDKVKEGDVRTSNIIAAKAVADAVRTSLGPKGMDKMIQSPKGNVIISNDGATILEQMKVFHPTAKMLVQLSKSQDIEAGDGTTSVVVIAGALLDACTSLLDKGIHPTVITECFQLAEKKAVEILRSMSKPVDLADRASLIQAATTSLSSKVIYQNAGLIAPMAVDAVLRVADLNTSTVDLEDVKVIEQLSGTIDDSEMVDGLVFPKKIANNGPKRIQNAKIGLIQFCLSAPKTDMENSIVVQDYQAMDRILRAERKYILSLCKKIKKSGCNVLLVQKSILRDATNDLSLHFLAKMKIMVITDIERDDVEFIAKTTGLRPIAHIDSMKPDKLAKAALVEEVGEIKKVVKVTGVENMGNTMTVLLRASNKLVLGEAGRSLHDALCVVRSLVKERFLICGGGAPEMEIALQLERHSKTLQGSKAYCLRAFAEALEVIPATLAENAGMHPLAIVTELRARHAQGQATFGVDVRKGCVADLSTKVLQPLLVNTSALGLATECVRMILKIDDLVHVR